MQRNSFWQPTARLGRTLLVILLGGGAVLWLSMLEGWPATPDGAFHLQRVRALSEAFAQGVLLPRNFPDFAFGYGYPVFNFYAPAFYYPPALLHLAGLDVLAATRLTLLATVLVSGAAMLGLLRALGLRPAAARFGALVFVLFPYRIYDYFVRGALPEFAAFLWLPCIAWSMVAAARANTPARRAETILIAGLCWSGLILTHNLTALMAAGASIVAIGAALLARRLLDMRGDSTGALRRVGLGFGLGLLLSAWYTVPALVETGNVAIGREASSGYANHFVAWRSLFDWGFPYTYPDAATPNLPLPAWLVLPGLAAILLLIMRRTRAKGSATQTAAVAATLSLMLLSIWLTTESSAFVWRLLAPILSRLQFPWRWQSILTLATAAALALDIEEILDGRPRRVVRMITLLAAAFVAVYTLAGAPVAARTDNVGEINRAAMWAFDAEQGQVGATWTAEFLPRWVTEQRWAIGREPPEGAPETAAPIDAAVALVDDGYLNATYRISSTVAVPLSFNRFYYPAWSVSVDGARTASDAVGALGLLAAQIPSGARTVGVQWAATPAVWLGRFLTLLGWLYGLLLILRIGRWRTGGMVLWVGLGLLLLAGSSGVTARSLPVQPSAADFGPVQLAGISAQSVRAGGVAPIAFHWLVQEQGGDLVTFIHLLAPDGSILAQVDAPLAGAYTPAARLAPGEIVRVEQMLPVPPDLAPGTYALRIGVYPAGQPDQPLTPTGSDTPYLTSMALEVLP